MMSEARGAPAGTELASDSDWVSAHLFHQGDLTHLAVQLVGPLTVELLADGLVTRWFFLRYWEGGQHIRFRALPVDPGARGEVEARTVERAQRYFARYPAADRMRPVEYAQLARALASAEQVDGYADQMYPNNSLVFLPYRREHERYGHGRAMETVERHFAESSRIALALLAGSPSPSQRDTAGLSMLLLAWLCADPDVARLAPSATALCESWAGRFNLSALGGDRADFQERYERQRARLLVLARRVRVIAAQSPDRTGPGVLAEWGRSVARLRDGLAAEVAAGRFAVPPRTGGTPPGHAREDQRGAVLPILDIGAHLQCNRIGVSIAEECYLRHLASRTLQALAQEPA